ncbi:cytochrome c-type biogenesis protein CcsB [Chromobacterium violaceum]|uniref:Cytochrome c-type biogenesis protein CcsB n=1 Tax=Chromobacterium violaceum TaxID=536 RepID=A0A3S4LMF9_CHRVL|nr:cytochrome c-type biogenesis protein CcsB [Chromobacterium violaceum]
MELATTRFDRLPLWRRLDRWDWAYALLIAVAAGCAFTLYHHAMDGYEQAILAGSALAWSRWAGSGRPGAGSSRWRRGGAAGHPAVPARPLPRQQAFWLKYALSSQSAIMWMCSLFFLATAVYWIGLAAARPSWPEWGRPDLAAAVMGLAGLFVRWYESYLIAPDVGHIPVSNLYEVFVLFTLITALMYLYYQAKFAAAQSGALVLPVISAAVGFILWYSFDRQAHGIQPLIPALQSWWMKIHVPANFVGYGAFSLAAMLGWAS